MGAVDFSPGFTPQGCLPPWQVALAFSYHTVLEALAELQGVMPLVTWAHQRLNAVFAGALRDSGFTSWVGDNASTECLVRKFGDVYPHETDNAHLRRLLDQEFTCRALAEPHALSGAHAEGGGVHECASVRGAGRQRLGWVGQRAAATLPGGGAVEGREGAQVIRTRGGRRAHPQPTPACARPASVQERVFQKLRFGAKRFIPPTVQWGEYFVFAPGQAKRAFSELPGTSQRGGA